MSDLPLDQEGREAARARISERHAQAAEVQARRQHRSVKCLGDYQLDAVPQHAGMPGGCRNDGTGCLCECHDPVGFVVGGNVNHRDRSLDTPVFWAGRPREGSYQQGS